MIHETYVGLETAKLLKEAGFDWGCDSFYGLDVRYRGESIGEDEEYELKAKGKKSEIEYVEGGMVYNFYHSNKKGEDYGGYSRPTLSVAQKWLREVKDIAVNVMSTHDYQMYSWRVRCVDMVQRDEWFDRFGFNTYEEALEAGINKCLTLILEE